MAKDNPEKSSRPRPVYEQRGFMSDVVVPLGQAAVSGGVGGYVGAKVGQGKNPPPDTKAG
jgi:hypothetical protein